MSDFFDQLEQEIRQAVSRRSHLRWYIRVRLPIRQRGLYVLLTTMLVATPAVAAVGAVSGWFRTGKPDVYYREAPGVGGGRATAGTRLLSLRVADPDGGPPWGVRLVKTTRGQSCLQVGRVEDGQLGSLGIDDSWDDDHEFHPIEPSDGAADICGATDAAGNGFVSLDEHGWTASAFIPGDDASGKAGAYCQAATASAVFSRRIATIKSELARLPAASKSRAGLEADLKRWRRIASETSTEKRCPRGSLRMIFVGLLGPEAKSVTYTTPSGQTRTERTVGGVGAYLIVFRQTAQNCDDYSRTALGGSDGCDENYGSTGGANLQLPNAVTRVTYTNGKTCSDQPLASAVALYRRFQKATDHRAGRQREAAVKRFLASHHLSPIELFRAAGSPQCSLVGWVASKQPAVTSSQVATRVSVTLSTGRRFCSQGQRSQSSIDDSTIACDRRIPKGFTAFYESPDGKAGPLYELARVSFIAREPVTGSNSFYEFFVKAPGNNGGGGGETQADIRRGQRVTFTVMEPVPDTGTDETAHRGTYVGVISYMQNVGKAGTDGIGRPGNDGSVIVGRFSFKVPESP